MTLYHCSYEEKLIITKNGRFGSFLFFDTRGAHYGTFTHKLTCDSLNIATREDIRNADIANIRGYVKAIAEIANCTENEAYDYLCEYEHFPVNDEASAEVSWDIQHLRAEAAKKLGFDGIECEDEYGISYMIDMYGREHLLELEI